MNEVNKTDKSIETHTHTHTHYSWSLGYSFISLAILAIVYQRNWNWHSTKQVISLLFVGVFGLVGYLFGYWILLKVFVVAYTFVVACYICWRSVEF